jgi:hypothetical protein
LLERNSLIFLFKLLDTPIHHGAIKIFTQLCYRMALYPYFLWFPISSDYIFKGILSPGTHSCPFFHS